MRFWKCLQDGPEKPPINYKPKNDLVQVPSNFVFTLSIAMEMMQSVPGRGNLQSCKGFWIDDLMSVLWRPSVPDLCIASTLRTRQKRRSRLRKPRAITALVDLLPVTNVQVARMMLDKYIHSSFWTHEMKVPAPWLQVFHVQRNA